MTRFNITLEAGVDLVHFALLNALGGEIFVPKIPSYGIEPMAKAICPECALEYVGIRPGEKIHEEMITESDSYYTIEFVKYFAILPPDADKSQYLRHFNAREVKKGFKYNSGTNDQWLNVDQIRELIKKYTDPGFKV